MRRLTRTLLTLAGAAGLGSAAAAQLASSPGYRLDGLRQEGAADGVSSPGFSALAGQEAAASEGVLSSPSFQAGVGFLAIHDPLDADAPTIHSVSPPHGPVAGGTPVTIGGLHFERNGLAGVVSATIGGAPLANLVVVSDTTITGEAPAGSYGPQDVEVTTALGTTGLEGAFVHSPGLWTSPVAWRTGELILRNYGPTGGATYQTWYSTATTSIPLAPFGTLLIGPSPLVPGIEDGLYPAPGGVQEVRAAVPDTATLIGATLHFQSIAVLSLAPLDVQFVNRSSTLFH